MIHWKKISLKDLAAFISQELKEQGINVVLVGGACATIYSNSRYLSYDLDFVTYENLKKVREVLQNLGFIEKGGCFRHKDCKWLVEFVAPPIAIGNEAINKFKKIKTALGTITMLKCEDSVKDRLASFFHWNDRQGLNQAIDICLECKVNLKEIEKWSSSEGFNEKFQEFVKCLKQKKSGSKKPTRKNLK